MNLCLHKYLSIILITILTSSSIVHDLLNKQICVRFFYIENEEEKIIIRVIRKCSKDTYYGVGIFERSPKSCDGRSCENGTYDLSRKYGSTGRHVSATVWGSEAHDGIRGALG